MMPSEHQEQVAVIQWAAQFPELKWLHAIPNGTFLAGDHRRRAIQMKNLKNEGLRSGVFDLFLPLPRGRYHGMYIEMKRQKGGRVSDAQIQFSADISARGYLCVVCNGASQAIEEISRYLSNDKRLRSSKSCRHVWEKQDDGTEVCFECDAVNE